jgi:LPS export ABC transporter protein LptC
MIRRCWPLLVACAFTACKNDLDQLARVDMDATAPDRVTTGAEYFYSDSGIVRNRLRAGKVEEYMTEERQKTVMSDGVELVFFNPDGGQGSVLTARQGLIKPRKNRMEVRDHVVFTNVRGERLETEHLVWSQDSDRVWTDQPVKIIRAEDILYGQGLDANEDFSRYTIRRLTGTLYVDPEDTLANPEK